MADGEIGRIYATVGFESTMAADGAKIASETKAIESVVEVSARNMNKAHSSIGSGASAAASGINGLSSSVAAMSTTTTQSLEDINKSFRTFRNEFNLFQAGFTGVPALISAGIAKTGMGMVSTYQDASVTLENMYQNGEEAKAIIQELIDVAVETPYTFPQLEQMAIQLKAMGLDVQSYQDAIINTAAATGKGVDEVTRSFVSSSMGYFRNLRAYGVEAWVVTNQNYRQFGLQADAVGKEMLSFVDKNGQQIVTTVDRYNQEAIASTVSMIMNDKYSGAMEARAGTISGLWSTFSDNMQQVFGQIMGYDLESVSVRTISVANAFTQLEKAGIAVSKVLVEMPGWMQDGIGAATIAAGAYSVYATAVGLAAVANTFFAGSMTLAGIASFAVGIGEAAVVAGLLVAGLSYLQEKFGILNPVIDYFNAELIVQKQNFSEVASLMESQAVSGWNSLTDAIHNATSAIDGYLEKHPLLNTAFEELKRQLGINHFENLIEGIKNYASATEEKASEIDASNRMWAKSAEEAGKKTTDVAGSVGISYNQMESEVGSSASGIESSNDSIGASAEKMADRVQNSVNNAIAEYKNQQSMISSLNATGFPISQNPTQDRDVSKYFSTDKEITSMSDKLTDALDKKADLYEKYEDTTKSDARALASIRDDISDQAELVQELTSKGVEGNSEVVNMERNITKAKKELAGLYSDNSITKAKERLSELYDTSNINKAKRDLQEIYADTSVQDAKERLSELYDTSNINKAKRDLQKLYDDTSIQKAKEKLSELYSTKDIDKAKRDLQEIYADTSVQDAKEKLSELYSTKDIDKAKRDLQDIYNDTSIQKAKEKLTELYSTKDIDKAKSDLQKLYADTSSIEDARERLQELYADDSVQKAKEELQKLYDDDSIAKEQQGLQKLYSDNSIAKEKEKLVELYSTEDIEKEKKKLQELYADDSILREKEKLTELYSTEDIDKEKSKLADLQGDLKNNKEYVANARRLIEEELATLQPVYDKYSIDASMGGPGSQEKLIEVTDRINELKRQLAQLISGGTGSQDYLKQLQEELGQATQQADDARIRMLENETPDSITSYIDAQNKVLDIQKQIAESKSNPSPDIVTDISTQIKDQQEKITQLVTDQAKSISDQLEKIAQMETDLVQKKADQQEKIAQMEEERVKRIQEQQEKIIQMEADHAQSIAEKQDKILQMEMDRAEKLTDQQNKIAKLEQERVKNIQDQQEKIAKLEQERQEKIIEQQEKIAQLEEERVKRIQDQQEKITQMEADQAKKINEQKEKIVELEAKRAKDIQDQQEKIAKLEADQAKKISEQKEKIAELEAKRAKDIQDQKEKIIELEKNQAEKIAEQKDKIVKMEADRAKDIADQKEKIAKLEADHSQKIADQKDKIVKMEADRAKDIADQKENIAKLEKERAEKIAEKQNQIVQLEKDLVQKKKDIDDKIQKAEDKLAELKTKYQETQDKQAEQRTELINQIAEQDKTIAKLQSDISALQVENATRKDKIFDPLNAANPVGTAETPIKLMGGGVNKNLPDGGMMYYDSKKQMQVIDDMKGNYDSIRSLYEWGYKNNEIIYAQDKAYKVLDSSLTTFSKDAEAAYKERANGGADVLFMDSKITQEYITQQGILNSLNPEAEGYYGNFTKVSKENLATPAQGMKLLWDNTGGAVLMFKDLDTYLTNVDKMSTAEAVTQLGYLVQTGQVGKEKAAELLKTVLHLDGVQLTNAQNQIGAYGDKSKESSEKVGFISSAVDVLTSKGKAVGGFVLDMLGIGTASASTSTEIGNAATSTDTLNSKKLDNAKSQADGLKIGYVGATGKIGDTSTGIDTINGRSTGNAQTQAGLLSGQYDTVTTKIGNTRAGLDNVNNTKMTGVQNETGLIGTIFDNVRNTSIGSFIAGGLAKVNSFRHTDLQNDTGLIGTIYDSVKNTSIGSFINDGLTRVNNFRHANLQNDTNLIGTIYDTVKNSKIASFINDGLSKVNSFKHTNLQNDTTLIGTVYDTVKNSKISSFIKDGLEKVNGFKMTEIQNQVNGIGTVSDQVKTKLGTFYQFIKDKVSEAGRDLWSLVSGGDSNNAGVSTANSFATGANSASANSSNAGKNITNSFATGADSNKQGATNAGTNSGNSFSNGVISTFQNAYNSGVSLVTNFANGVVSKIPAVQSAANAVTTAYNNYMPHSPAKEGPLSVLPNWDAVLYDPIVNSFEKTKTLIPSMAQTLKDITSPIKEVAPAINSSFNSIGIQRSQMPAYSSSNGSVAKMVSTTMYNVNHNVKAGTINYNGTTLQTKRLQSVI